MTAFVTTEIRVLRRFHPLDRRTAAALVLSTLVHAWPAASAVADPQPGGRTVAGWPTDSDSGASGTIVGRVVSQGAPIRLANLLVAGTTDGAVTRRDGWFRLPRVPIGRQVVRVLALDYLRDSIVVDRVRGGLDSVEVELHPVFASPCTSDTFTPSCFRSNPDEMKRAGRRCGAHHRSVLLPDTVRIVYGLVAGNRELLAAQRRSFPNARTSWDGGCVVSSRSPRFTEGAYCPQCRTACDRWWVRARSRRR